MAGPSGIDQTCRLTLGGIMVIVLGCSLGFAFIRAIVPFLRTMHRFYFGDGDFVP